MEDRISEGTKVKDLETGEAFTIRKAIEIDNRWGYGKYIYQFEETIAARPCFGLYRKEFQII